MYVTAKFDGLLPRSMHPIAVQVKAIAVGGIGPYPESVNKERIFLSLARIVGH
jgi:hypothetical protein